jgi:3-methyladenine DNA glycosylase AlkC
MGAMDELINPNLVTELRDCFLASGPASTRRPRKWLALENSGGTLQDRPLRARVDTVRDAIIEDIGHDFDSLTDVLNRSLQQDRFKGWMIWPVTEAVAQLAVDASAPESDQQAPGAFEVGLELMRQLTSRLSAEFALRIFLDADAARTIDVATTWCYDPDEHVRRLASEGTRSYLPWAKQVTELHLRPTLTLPIIDALYRDDSAYVRRSVGNHVNDLSRRHPELVVEIGKRWLAAPDHNTQALIKRAFRTLIKAGDAGALAALGFGGDAEVRGPLLDRRSVRIGEDIEVRAIVTNPGAAPTRLAVDYVVNYRKDRGKVAPKVFKMATVNLNAGETTELTKRRSFAATNTRVLYPGVHSVELQVNGRRHGSAEFELVGQSGVTQRPKRQT